MSRIFQTSKTNWTHYDWTAISTKESFANATKLLYYINYICK